MQYPGFASFHQSGYDPRQPAGLQMPQGGFSAARPSCGAAVEPSTRTQQPIVTGTGVVGIKFNGGVMLAADTLGEARVKIVAMFVFLAYTQ